MSWDTIRADEFCESVRDGTHDTPKQTETGYKLVTGKHIKNGQIDPSDAYYISEEDYRKINERSVVEQWDVLMSMIGTVGEVAVVKDYPNYAIKNVALFKCAGSELNGKWLAYYLRSADAQGHISGNQKGSSQQFLSLKQLRSLPVPIADKAYMQKVVDILSAYDDLIENNQKQIKLLEEAAQRLYKEWFVDLRFPGYETTPIIDGVPEGWVDKGMEDICDSVGGGTPSTKNDEYYRDGKIKWVTPTDITRKNGLILLDTEKKITEEGLQHSSAKMVPPYTILMTSRASVGFFGLCEYDVCTNQGFISCIPYKENIRLYLLYNLMNRVDEIRAKASGSTFLEISKKSFRGLRVFLPTDDVLDAFTKLVCPMVQQMEILTKSIATLQEARDRLLPKLMSGEIEV